MNVDCFYCLRYLLMFIIFVNMILGLSLLGGSLWTFLHGDKMGNVFADTDGFNYILYFLMALGSLKFLLGFLGCCSVVKKNSKMLGTFFALVLIVFLGQVAAGVWLYVDEDKVTTSAKDSLADFIQNDYGTADFESKTHALDNLQMKFQCCGSNEPADWKTSAYNEENTPLTLGEYVVPPSCCINSNNETETCEEARHISGPIPSDAIFEEGCISMIIEQIFNYGAEILGVIGGVILIELFVMSSTLILCRSQNVRYKI